MPSVLWVIPATSAKINTAQRELDPATALAIAARRKRTSRRGADGAGGGARPAPQPSGVDGDAGGAGGGLVHAAAARAAGETRDLSLAAGDEQAELDERERLLALRARADDKLG